MQAWKRGSFFSVRSTADLSAINLNWTRQTIPINRFTSIDFSLSLCSFPSLCPPPHICIHTTVCASTNGSTLYWLVYILPTWTKLICSTTCSNFNYEINFKDTAVNVIFFKFVSSSTIEGKNNDVSFILPLLD